MSSKRPPCSRHSPPRPAFDPAEELVSDAPLAGVAAPPTPSRRPDIGALGLAVRSARTSLRQALGNDGIRRLGLAWMLGIAADSALVVVTLVTVFNRGGVLAAGLLGAVRMVPAIAVGVMRGSVFERLRGGRI